MKTSCLLPALAVLLAALAHADAQNRKRPSLENDPKPGESVIVERGAHHRVWKQARVATLPGGQLVTNVSSYTELGSGLHRWDGQNQQWVDAEAKLEIVGNNALGRSAAHQVLFAPNANTAGAIDFLTSDGKRLRSHVLGIAFFDAATGQSEMIAELKDSAGELHAPNVVIYPEAFDGLKADLRYTYRLGGFEQDVILYENPPLPAGFNPDSTRLEVWTEFIEAPASTIKQRGRAGMTDDTIDFGAMQTAASKVFASGLEPQSKRTAPAAKRWLTIEGGRTFLIEAVRLLSVKPDLDKLPASKGHARANPPPPRNAPLDRVFPSAPPVRQARQDGPEPKFKLAVVEKSPAKLAQIRPALVLDYNLTASLTNYTLKCDTTYVVSNAVNFYETTTIEGGCVVKFAKTNVAGLVLQGPSVWATELYRPAVFTAVDDHSVGESIGSGTLSGYYGGDYLMFNYIGEVPSYLRIAHAASGIELIGGEFTMRHSQFVHCDTALSLYSGNDTCAVALENILFHDINTVRSGAAYVTAHQLTVHQCANFSTGATAGSGDIFNSLFIRQTNWGNVTFNLNSCHVGSDSSIFQTVGAGAHYLAANSPHRNAGTTAGLSATLLTDLKKQTTYPPLVFSNNLITVDTVLYPQARRDTDTPDLGAHFAPIDYAVGWLSVSNATLTLAGGVAVAAFNSTGFWLQPNSRLISAGSPTARNTIVRYNLVQEQPVRWGSWSGYTMMIPTSSAELSLRFTDVWLPREGGTAIYTSGGSYVFSNLVVRDCAFSSDSVRFIGGGANNVFCLTNNLFHRSIVDFSGYSQILAINNLFYGGFLGIDQYGVQTGWILRNNILDSVSLDDLNEYAELNYNAYVGGTTPISPGTNATDKVVTSISYNPGPLGRFYLPTNSVLINVGSTNANYLGFYHYTTSATNQVKETNSFVDIGLHYVAVNSSAQAIDGDGDGVPDYLEDANGNSTFDSSAGETDWQGYNSKLGIGSGPGLIIFTPLK